MIEEKEFNDSTGKSHSVVEFKQDEDDRFPFSFGIRKAKIILKHVKELEKFVEDNDT